MPSLAVLGGRRCLSLRAPAAIVPQADALRLRCWERETLPFLALPSCHRLMPSLAVLQSIKKSLFNSSDSSAAAAAPAKSYGRTNSATFSGKPLANPSKMYTEFPPLPEAEKLGALNKSLNGMVRAPHNMDYLPTRMALITSDCVRNAIPEHRMALTTSNCGTMQYLGTKWP